MKQPKGDPFQSDDRRVVSLVGYRKNKGVFGAAFGMDAGALTWELDGTIHLYDIDITNGKVTGTALATTANGIKSMYYYVNTLYIKEKGGDVFYLSFPQHSAKSTATTDYRIGLKGIDWWWSYLNKMDVPSHSKVDIKWYILLYIVGLAIIIIPMIISIKSY